MNRLHAASRSSRIRSVIVGLVLALLGAGFIAMSAPAQAEDACDGYAAYWTGWYWQCGG